MKIIYSSNKLRRRFNKYSLLVRKYGSQQARVIQQRLYELDMADTLADISYLPPTRCHELVGNRAGQFSLDLNHPYRLIIEPSHDPIPRKDDGGIERSQVTSVLIIDVEDTHG